MTIGINLLREAREKFAAAVAAVKDELKNPDTADEVRPAAIELGSAFDEHLTDLGDAVSNGNQAERQKLAQLNEPEPIDKGESQPNDVEPAHETLAERIEEEGGEAKSNQ